MKRRPALPPNALPARPTADTPANQKGAASAEGLLTTVLAEAGVAEPTRAVAALRALLPDALMSDFYGTVGVEVVVHGGLILWVRETGQRTYKP